MGLCWCCIYGLCMYIFRYYMYVEVCVCVCVYVDVCAHGLIEVKYACIYVQLN